VPYPHCGVNTVLLRVEPVDGQTTESVTDSQCNVRPMATFLATEHHCPLASTKLYRLVNRGTEQLAHDCYLAVHRMGVKPATSRLHVRHATFAPHRRAKYEVWSDRGIVPGWDQQTFQIPNKEL